MVPRVIEWADNSTDPYVHESVLFSSLVRAANQETILEFSADITRSEGQCVGVDDVQVIRRSGPVGGPLVID